MPSLALAGAPAALTVRPWPDAVIDSLGHDPRSPYVERFWLAILGPSATWLLRHLVAGLEAEPAGFELTVDETARALGLGVKPGRHAPIVRTLGRCSQFRMVHLDPSGEVLLVRRKLPPLNRTQVCRLPEGLQVAHRQWQEAELRRPDAEVLRGRARRLALSLFELGENVEATERQLHRWRFPPGIAREATAWGWDRHRRARDAAGAAGAGGAAGVSGTAATPPEPA